MVDGSALAAVADAAVGANAPTTVLEIGPGLGFLTRELLSRGFRVVAVEKDRAFAKHLEEHFKDSNFKLFEKDILKVTPKEDLGLRAPLTVAANIPYNITSSVLEWLLNQRSIVSRAVLTMQWEVALRLKAIPGTKDWGSLSVFVQTYAEVRLVRKISKNSFFPAPKVDSAVVELILSQKPRHPISDETLFFKIVRRSFQKRRKTALNALADAEETLFSKARLLAAFGRAGLDPIRRPETFTIPEWARLTKSMLY